MAEHEKKQKRNNAYTHLTSKQSNKHVDLYTNTQRCKLEYAIFSLSTIFFLLF